MARTDGSREDMYPDSNPRADEFHSDTDDDIHETTTILLPPPELTTSPADFEDNVSLSGNIITYVDPDKITLKSSFKKVNVPAVNPPPAENEPEYEEISVPPDGGFGWMVLLGSIIVNILIPGTVKSFGILFVEFIEVFEASPAEAAWIPALSYWLYSSVGPFACALSVKYSHRAVTIVGGLLASSGLMISYFATSIPFLYVSYGVIGGLGAGLSYPIGVLMVGQYFDKLRGLANGLCTSGSALGSVIVPFLLRHLLVQYGYREAILIMGAILLNVCVGAMFFQPVQRNMKKIKVPILRETDEEAPIPMSNYNSCKVMSSNSETKRGRISSNHVGIIKSTGSSVEMASSMPITIPVQCHSQEIRDLDIDRRGSGTIRRATFQIGHETPVANSWSLRSTEEHSLLGMQHFQEEMPGLSSPNSLSATQNFRGKSHVGLDTMKDMEDMVEGGIPGTTQGGMATLGIGGTTPTTGAPNLASRCTSRANLTAIPEDEDNESETRSREGDWNYYAELPVAKQRLIRLSTSSGNQLHLPTLTSQGNSSVGLSRTMSVASNVSSSSFHYVSTHHHGGMLAAMQLDKNVPQFASSITLKSVRKSCCSKLSDLCIWSRRNKPHCEDRDVTMETVLDNVDRIEEPKKKAEKSVISKFIDLSLLRDGIYLVILLSNSTTAIGYTNFLIILPAYAVSLGFDKSEASWLLSIVAALDFVGRIGGSAISDLKFIRRKWFYIVGLFFSGIALILLPMGESYKALAMFCSLFGLASGLYVGVTAVLLADELGIDRLGSSYGISLFVNGTLQLAGPPICGSLIVWQNSYNKIIRWLGIILVVGSLFWTATPFIEHRRNRAAEVEELAAQIDKNKMQTGSTPLPQGTSSV